jgi:hypothetical protein
MSVLQFGRSASLIFGVYGTLGVAFDDLRITFDVTKTKRSSANQATVTVYNLAERNRKRLQAKGTALSLLVGYGGAMQLLCSGEVNHGTVAYQSPNWVSAAEILDGQGALRESALSRTWPTGTPKSLVYATLAGALTGIALGPVEALPFVGITSAPLSVSGSVRTSLDMIASAWGFTWSIQDGIIEARQIGGIGNGLATAPLLSPQTGLIGSPEWTDDGLDVRCLLTPSVRPGGRVVVQSKTANGVFQVESVRHSGDTHGSDWTTSATVTEV